MKLPSIDDLATENKMTRAKLKLQPLSRIYRLNVQEKELISPLISKLHTGTEHFFFFDKFLIYLSFPSAPFKKERQWPRIVSFQKASHFQFPPVMKAMSRRQEVGSVTILKKYIYFSHHKPFFFSLLDILHCAFDSTLCLISVREWLAAA